MISQDNSWHLLETFFISFSYFNNLESKYRAHVSELTKAVKSSDHLPSDLLLEFIDVELLNSLRDNYLARLRKIAHNEFRLKKITERFDVYISEIFHEVSILKEQKYIMEHYLQRKSQLYPEMLKQLLQQTLQLFATKMEHVKVLYHNAQSRLEEILPIFRLDDFFLRSLFLKGDKFLKDFYKDPTIQLLAFMNEQGGSSKGLVATSCSFCLGGFYEQAKDVLVLLKKDDLKDLNEEVRKLYDKVNGFLTLHQANQDKASVYETFTKEISPLLVVLKQN